MLNSVTILHVACQGVVVKTINLDFFVEVVQACDPLQWIAGVGLNANFLSDLAQVWQAIRCLRWEWNKTRSHCWRECCTVATVNVSTAVELRFVVTSNGIDS